MNQHGKADHPTMASNHGDSNHLDPSPSDSSSSGGNDSDFLTSKDDIDREGSEFQRYDGKNTGEETPVERYPRESTRNKTHIHSGTESSNVTQLPDPRPETRHRKFAHQLNRHLLGLGGSTASGDDYLRIYSRSPAYEESTTPIDPTTTSQEYDADHEESISSNSSHNDDTTTDVEETTEPPAAKKRRSLKWWRETSS